MDPDHPFDPHVSKQQRIRTDSLRTILKDRILLRSWMTDTNGTRARTQKSQVLSFLMSSGSCSPTMIQLIAGDLRVRPTGDYDANNDDFGRPQFIEVTR